MSEKMYIITEKRLRELLEKELVLADIKYEDSDIVYAFMECNEDVHREKVERLLEGFAEVANKP